MFINFLIQDGFVGISKFTKIYTLNICNLLYDSLYPNKAVKNTVYIMRTLELKVSFFIPAEHKMVLQIS